MPSAKGLGVLLLSSQDAAKQTTKSNETKLNYTILHCAAEALEDCGFQPHKAVHKIDSQRRARELVFVLRV
jgi:hypothetical protein